MITNQGRWYLDTAFFCPHRILALTNDHLCHYPTTGPGYPKCQYDDCPLRQEDE